MTFNISIDKFKHIIIVTTLFFLAMNFKAKFFYFAFIAFFLLILMQKRLLIHPNTLLYMALGVLMAIYNSEEGIISVSREFGSAALYLVGYNSVIMPTTSDSPSMSKCLCARKKAFSVIFAIAAGAFTHYILNFITNFNKGIGRNTIDIWSKATMAATGQAALASLMVGFSVAMIIMPERKYYRYWGIFCILCTIAYNLVLAGRTLLVIIFLLFVIGMLYVLVSIKSTSKKIKLLFSVIMVLLLVLALFFSNLGGIQESLFNSNFFRRFSTASIWETERTSSQIQFLLNAWRYPFGGLHLRQKYGYAHDLLLDGYDEYGVLGFCLLLIILISGIKSVYKLFRYADYEHTFKLEVLCVYCAILLVFCVEPILAGFQWLFVCYSMINGCIAGLVAVGKME